MVGRTLAHYRILERIGAGGMGVVYRARDTQLERPVALKVVADSAQADERARSRLLQEARAASALNHPNICTVYEVGNAEGQTYIAMELVEGRPLNAVIGRGDLPVEAVIRYGAQLADALAHAHERGVIHRDLKGANVIVTPEGRPKILDFGLARRVTGETEQAPHTMETLTAEGVVAGTVPYMAPEVLNGERADARSDLWALGVLLYQALTGRLPFQGRTAFDLTSAILRDPVPPLPASVPPGVAAIVRRLLEKSPGERYQRAGEVRAALEALQQPDTASGPVTPAPSSRRRWLWTGAAVPLLGAAAWLGFEQWKRPAGSATEPRLSDGNRASGNAEANEYYERGLQFSGIGPHNEIPQWRRMMERALELDPKFAAARGQYAFTQQLEVLFGDSNDPSLLYKAEEGAREALRLDPTCSIAHSALAHVYLLVGRKELIPGEVAAALQRNPHDPAIHLCLACYHLANGDYQQAARKLKEIVAEFPTFGPARAYLGQVQREQGDSGSLIREMQRALEVDQNNPFGYWNLARGYMDSGELPNARQALERVAPQHRSNHYGRLHWALLLALEGKKTEALRELDEQTLNYAGTSYLGPLLPAEVYAVMGDSDKALDWLDRAVRWGDEREDWMRRDPHLANIRGQTRFQQVLEAVAYRRKQRSAARPQNQ